MVVTLSVLSCSPLTSIIWTSVIWTSVIWTSVIWTSIVCNKTIWTNVPEVSCQVYTSKDNIQICCILKTSSSISIKLSGSKQKLWEVCFSVFIHTSVTDYWLKPASCLFSVSCVSCCCPTWLRDVVPERRVEGVLGPHDLWKQTSFIFLKEWRVATEPAAHRGHASNPSLDQFWFYSAATVLNMVTVSF